MRQALQTRAFERVASVLEAGEQPVVAARAMVGGFSTGRFATAVKQGTALSGHGSAGAEIRAAQSKQFVVLTDRRVIFLPQTFLGGPGKKILGELPRAQVSLAEADMGFMSVLRLALAEGDGLSLTFPKQDKKNAEALAAALQQAPTT